MGNLESHDSGDVGKVQGSEPRGKSPPHEGEGGGDLSIAAIVGKLNRVGGGQRWQAGGRTGGEGLVYLWK